MTSSSTKPHILGLRTVLYRVTDLEQAKAWYSSVLGIEPYFGVLRVGAGPCLARAEGVGALPRLLAR